MRKNVLWLDERFRGVGEGEVCCVEWGRSGICLKEEGGMKAEGRWGEQGWCGRLGADHGFGVVLAVLGRRCFQLGVKQGKICSCKGFVVSEATRQEMSGFFHEAVKEPCGEDGQRHEGEGNKEVARFMAKGILKEETAELEEREVYEVEREGDAAHPCENIGG